MINSFLLIGQSNMAGRGRLDDVEPITNNDVFMFRENDWIIAKEPIHTDKPELAGIGLGMSFADELQKESQKCIGLVPCAVGGTSLDEWRKGGELYTNAVNTIRKALEKSKLKGILWHQGEADSGTMENANSYKERFVEMISSLKNDIDCSDVPVIVGGLGDFLELLDNKCNHWPVINKALNQLCIEDSTFVFVNSEQLTHNGDTLHFNSQSLREFGLRYGQAWKKYSAKYNLNLE